MMNNQFQKVTIIVPVYNAEKTIKECINSILEIDYPKEKLELIFVNNSSTDRTENILNEFKDKIKILYEKKRGPAAARNKGLLNASGEIIAFTDSDCVVERNWLKNIIKPLKDEQVGIAGGKILARIPYNKIEKFGESIHDHKSAINVFKPPYAISMNWASRLSTLKKMNLFNDNFIRCQDVELSYRIHIAGYKIVYVPEAVVYHRNESTLTDLFMEGYSHGLHSVQAIKKYKDLLVQFGYRRINLKGYKKIGTDIKEYFLNKKSIDSLCSATFNSGKKIGKIFGSIKNFYLDI